MREETCIFCKIANGEIPSHTLYEDEDCRIILDIAPATQGHALLIMKDHYENLWDLPEEKATKAFRIVKKMAMKLKDSLQCEGLNIVQNNGSVAGQTVMHFHIHMIPRYKNDNQIVGWKIIENQEIDFEKIKEICMLEKK